MSASHRYSNIDVLTSPSEVDSEVKIDSEGQEFTHVFRQKVAIRIDLYKVTDSFKSVRKNQFLPANHNRRRTHAVTGTHGTYERDHRLYHSLESGFRDLGSQAMSAARKRALDSDEGQKTKRAKDEGSRNWEMRYEN
eukprot:1357736-Amorphochlora_amoeboformis.AAC.1